MRKPAPDESEPARETVGAARNLGISAQKKGVRTRSVETRPQ